MGISIGSGGGDWYHHSGNISVIWEYWGEKAASRTAAGVVWDYLLSVFNQQLLIYFLFCAFCVIAWVEIG